MRHWPTLNFHVLNSRLTHFQRAYLAGYNIASPELGGPMRRRDFIMLFAGTAAAWDQRTCLIQRGFRLRLRIAVRVHETIRERDL